MQFIKRGDIYLADFEESDNAKFGGIRPVIIIQNDIINKFSPTVIVAPLTSCTYDRKLPTHVLVSKGHGLPVDSLIILEQIKTIHKTNIKKKIGQTSSNLMLEVEKALSLATSNSKIDNVDSSDYKNVYSPEYDLMEIKEMIKSSNYIGNRIKDWTYSGIIGALIGMLINSLISKVRL